MIVNTKQLDPAAVLPSPTTSGSAGADLSAIEAVSVPPGQAKLVKTGLAVAIPFGYTGLVCSRSGLALKKQVFVLNAPGVIDSDYRGDLGVILFNAGTEPFEVAAGDRIAQLLVVKAEGLGFQLAADLPPTSRGAGGFGSTGTA